MSKTTFSQSKSFFTEFLNIEAKVDSLTDSVTEIQFRIKVTCRQQIKILSGLLNYCLSCFKSDIWVRKVCI